MEPFLSSFCHFCYNSNSMLVFHSGKAKRSARLGSRTRVRWNHEKNRLCLLRKYLSEPHGGVCHEGLDGSVWDWKSGHLELGTWQSHPSGNPENLSTTPGPVWSSQDFLTDQKEEDFYNFDLILGMDRNNVADLKQMAPSGTEHKIHLLLLKVCQIPWYTGDFEGDLF